LKDRPRCAKCAYGKALGMGIERNIICLWWGGAYEYGGTCRKFDKSAEAKLKAKELWDEMTGGEEVSLNVRYGVRKKKEGVANG